MCRFCKVSVCVGLWFVISECLYFGGMQFVVVSMCGFCNVWMCVCVEFVMCGCVYGRDF